jgi:hypothetical protein
LFPKKISTILLKKIHGIFQEEYSIKLAFLVVYLVMLIYLFIYFIMSRV